MENVINKLKEYANQIDLSERYDFNFDHSHSIFTESESNNLAAKENRYEQNISLKSILNKKYKQGINNLNELDFYIINTWGGIKAFKKNESNKQKLKEFRLELPNQRLSRKSFSTISSLSKISSFMDPDRYVIYDSRVIFTLNWLIMSCENQNSINTKYFPLPSGRNKIIANFDMNTILNLFHISEYKNNKSLYISYTKAYFDYCNFVKKAVIEVYGNSSKPYQLEMLLFTLADKEIFEELKKSLKLEMT